eukprot:3875730-Rhodomonas_salina.2
MNITLERAVGHFWNRRNWLGCLGNSRSFRVPKRYRCSPKKSRGHGSAEFLLGFLAVEIPAGTRRRDGGYKYYDRCSRNSYIPGYPYLQLLQFVIRVSLHSLRQLLLVPGRSTRVPRYPGYPGYPGGYPGTVRRSVACASDTRQSLAHSVTKFKLPGYSEPTVCRQCSEYPGRRVLYAAASKC